MKVLIKSITNDRYEFEVDLEEVKFYTTGCKFKIGTKTVALAEFIMMELPEDG